MMLSSHTTTRSAKRTKFNQEQTNVIIANLKHILRKPVTEIYFTDIFRGVKEPEEITCEDVYFLCRMTAIYMPDDRRTLFPDDPGTWKLAYKLIFVLPYCPPLKSPILPTDQVGNIKASTSFTKDSAFTRRIPDNFRILADEFDAGELARNLIHLCDDIERAIEQTSVSDIADLYGDIFTFLRDIGEIAVNTESRSRVNLDENFLNIYWERSLFIITTIFRFIGVNDAHINRDRSLYTFRENEVFPCSKSTLRYTVIPDVHATLKSGVVVCETKRPSIRKTLWNPDFTIPAVLNQNNTAGANEKGQKFKHLFKQSMTQYMINHASSGILGDYFYNIIYRVKEVYREDNIPTIRISYKMLNAVPVKDGISTIIGAIAAINYKDEEWEGSLDTDEDTDGTSNNDDDDDHDDNEDNERKRRTKLNEANKQKFSGWFKQLMGPALTVRNQPMTRGQVSRRSDHTLVGITDHETVYEILQDGYRSASEVLRISLETYMTVFDIKRDDPSLKKLSADDTDVVLKIYDKHRVHMFARVCKEEDLFDGWRPSNEEMWEWCLSRYDREVEMYKLIDEYNSKAQEESKLHTPKLLNYGPCVIYDEHEIQYDGYLIAMTKIDVQCKPKTAEEFADGYRQLQILNSKLGVYHNDVRRRNIGYNHKTKHFCFFDFDHASRDEPYEDEGDCAQLKCEEQDVEDGTCSEEEYPVYKPEGKLVHV